MDDPRSHENEQQAETWCALCLAFTQHPLPTSMSKRIFKFKATLSDPDFPDAGAETEYDEEPGKSEDSSSDSGGQQSPLKSSKAEGLTGEAMEEDSASDADDQQTPPSVTAKGQARAAKARGPNSTRQWKEYNLLSHSDNTNAEIMAFVRADLADLNKKAGITSLPPRHYDRKTGNIYGD